MSQGICRLCGRLEDLRNSHVIPSFVFKWMKETSVTGFMRSGKEPNLRSQDGFKTPLLCESCEQRLSLRERWFKLHVFEPYIQSGTPIPDEEELLFFAISLLWRAAETWDWQDQEERASVEGVLENWRRYLLDETSLLGVYPHVFLTDLPNPEEPKHSMWEALYVARATDIAIVPWDGLLMAYVKFARFVFIGPIIGYEPELWKGTLIQGTGGQINPAQGIRDPRFGSFFVNRPIQAPKLFQSDMSERQARRIDKAYDNRKKPPGSTDLDKVTQASEAQPFDPTGYALSTLSSSLPSDFGVKEDFTIAVPPDYCPVAMRQIEMDGWHGPQMVFQTGFSPEKNQRVLLVYGIAPDGKGHLFGFSFQGLFDSPIGEPQPLTEGEAESQAIATEQHQLFQEWIDCALTHLSDDCSL